MLNLIIPARECGVGISLLATSEIPDSAFSASGWLLDNDPDKKDLYHPKNARLFSYLGNGGWAVANDEGFFLSFLTVYL